jgi:hypothetical protein
MPWKPFEIIFGMLIAEIIEEEEWIKIRCITKTECSVKTNTCTLHGRFGVGYFSDGT